MNRFDQHCNRYNDFIFHLIRHIKNPDEPIAEIEAYYGETSKALSYLLPKCKFDIFNSDEYVLSLAEQELQKYNKTRKLTERLNFVHWDINYILTDRTYQLAFTENYLSGIDFKHIPVVWSNLSNIASHHSHLVTVTKNKDISYYREALRSNQPKIKYFSIRHLNPDRKFIVLETWKNE